MLKSHRTVDIIVLPWYHCRSVSSYSGRCCNRDGFPAYFWVSVFVQVVERGYSYENRCCQGSKVSKRYCKDNIQNVTERKNSRQTKVRVNKEVKSDRLEIVLRTFMRT